MSNLRPLLVALMLVYATAACAVPTLKTLTVLAPSSFAQTLTSDQVAIFYEEQAQLAAFYEEALKGKLAFSGTLLQLPTGLGPYAFTRATEKTVHLLPEDLAPLLGAFSVKPQDYGQVSCYWAMSYTNPLGLQPAYGAGAQPPGPETKALGEVAFLSEPVFCWDEQQISLLAIHEWMHLFDAWLSDQPEVSFPSPDDEATELAAMKTSGVQLPTGMTWQQAQQLADETLAGRGRIPWALQALYYKWALERVPAEAWGKLKAAPEAPPSPLRPLFSRYLLPAGAECLVACLLDEGAVPGGSVVALAGAEELPLQRVTRPEVDFGETNGEATYFLLRLPATAADTLTELTLVVREASGREIARTSVQIEHYKVAWVEGPEEAWAFPDLEQPAQLEVGLGSTSSLAGEVKLQIEVAGKKLPLTSLYEGLYRTELPLLAQGEYIGTVSGTVAGKSVLPKRVAYHITPAYGIQTPALLSLEVGKAGFLPIRPYCVAGPTGKVTLTASLGKAALPLELTEGDLGVTWAALPGDLPAGMYLVEMKADFESAPKQVTQTIQVHIALKGRIEASMEARPEGDYICAKVLNEAGEPLAPGLVTSLWALVDGKNYELKPEEGKDYLGAALPLPVGASTVAVFRGGANVRAAWIEAPGRGLTGAAPLEVPLLICGPQGEEPASPWIITGETRLRLTYDEKALYITGESRDAHLIEGDQVVLALDLASDSFRQSYPSEQPAREQLQPDDVVVVLNLAAPAGQNTPELMTRAAWAAIPGATLILTPTATGCKFEARLPLGPVMGGPVPAGFVCQAALGRNDATPGAPTQHKFAALLPWDYVSERSFQLWKNLPLLFMPGGLDATN